MTFKLKKILKPPKEYTEEELLQMVNVGFTFVFMDQRSSNEYKIRSVTIEFVDMITPNDFTFSATDRSKWTRNHIVDMVLRGEYRVK